MQQIERDFMEIQTRFVYRNQLANNIEQLKKIIRLMYAGADDEIL